MQDFPRSPIGQAGGDVEAEDAEAESQDRAAAAGATAASPSPSSAPKKNVGAVGNAMKALFESSDVSIRRGDETRVMSRAQEALAELQHKSNPPPASRSNFPPASAEVPRSVPPGPRVDKGLWIVLALGLFAIAGWMLAYSL